MHFAKPSEWYQGSLAEANAGEIAASDMTLRQKIDLEELDFQRLDKVHSRDMLSFKTQTIASIAMFFLPEVSLLRSSTETRLFSEVEVLVALRVGGLRVQLAPYDILAQAAPSAAPAARRRQDAPEVELAAV